MGKKKKFHEQFRDLRQIRGATDSIVRALCAMHYWIPPA